jgi:ABC-type glycerol-3-phosphate transport system permease component
MPEISEGVLVAVTLVLSVPAILLSIFSNRQISRSMKTIEEMRKGERKLT